MTADTEVGEVDPFTQPKRNVVTDLNKKALLRQVYMSALCITSPLIAGACYSQPSITIAPLTDQNEPVFLTKDQASWYGEYLYCNILSLYDTGVFCSCVPYHHSTAWWTHRDFVDG